MLKWFRDCKNTKDCKSKYHALCRQYHPDMSGKDTTAEMQEINNEFKEAFEYFKAHEAHGSPEQEKQTNRRTVETPEHFMKIIEKLIHCDGLTIEIIGSWIWVSGSVSRYLRVLKGMGFEYSTKHKKYYLKDSDTLKIRSHYSYEQLKDKYGYQEVKTVATPLIK